jgi:transcriptional regulator with GAF, ATPase, and Fis domain
VLSIDSADGREALSSLSTAARSPRRSWRASFLAMPGAHSPMRGRRGSASSRQPKILRALQERKVRPVGAGAEIAIDVRIVAATNRDLDVAVEERRFREDLYFRLNVIQVALPALRSRAGDVLPLAQHFLETFAKRAGKGVTAIAAPAAERLVSYSWPGNVRELQNCIERAVTLARFEHVHRG